MIKIKKITATITIAAFLFVTIMPTTVCAEMWGTNIASGLMQQAMQQVFEITRKTVLQTLKKEANNMIKESIEKAVSGSSGESMVISSYEDFIFGAAQVAAENKLEDFFSVIQEGVSTSERDMLRNVEQTISSQLSPGQPEATLHELVDSDDPIGDVFDQTRGGGVGAFLSYQFGDYNNSTNAYVNAMEVIDNEAMQKAQAQEAEAIAGGGFNTITEGNKVIPGKISQEIVAAAETMPIEMINNAGSLEEVIASFVVSSVTSFVKSGINVVAKPINNEVRRIERTIGTDGINVLQDRIKKGLTI